MSRRPERARPQAGFTFLGLMFIIAIMGVMAAAASTTCAFVVQRDEEAQLLFVGGEFSAAIGRYATAHGREPQPYPTTLEQLLADKASLTPVRYLRRLYFDPMTGDSAWGLVRNPQGGITGVFSLSERRPVRRRGPANVGIAFGDAKTYRDWVFSATRAARDPNAPIPGWNYERDGSPPLSWDPSATPQPPAPPASDPGELVQ